MVWPWHLAWDLSPVRAHSLWAGLCPEKLLNKQINKKTKSLEWKIEIYSYSLLKKDQNVHSKLLTECSSFFSLLATARFQTANVQYTTTNANVHWTTPLPAILCPSSLLLISPGNLILIHRSGPAVGVPKIQPTVATSALAPQVGEQVVLHKCNFVHCIHHSED